MPAPTYFYSRQARCPLRAVVFIRNQNGGKRLFNVMLIHNQIEPFLRPSVQATVIGFGSGNLQKPG
jgi:hypothetical protein